MSVTIKNDTGGTLGTKIIAENGEDIAEMLAVESLSIDFGDANSVIRANIVLGLVKTQINSDHVEYVTKNPLNKKFEAVKKIEFNDGTIISFIDGDISYSRSDVSTFQSISDGRTYKFKNKEE